MIYIAYFIFFFGGLFTVVALLNLLTHVSLPKKAQHNNKPLVSILIPARNEEQNIANLLDDIQLLTYTHYEVVVYDDQSTDKTRQIVAHKALQDHRIQLLSGKTLEPNWLGKNFACHQLALHAKGAYLLFLDADVRVSGDLIEKTLGTMMHHNLGLLSIFPKQILDNRGAWYTVPIMNWILLSLLPLILVRLSSWRSFSAANGQFMLFDAKQYHRLQAHSQCKNSKAEDIAICQYYKKQGVKVATLLGNDSIRCKMYQSLDEAVKGFSKNVFAFFGNSVLATLAFAFFSTFAPFVLLFAFGYKYFAGYLALVLIKRIVISKASDQAILPNLMYLPIQHFMFLKIICSALIHRKSLSWKGRQI